MLCCVRFSTPGNPLAILFNNGPLNLEWKKRFLLEASIRESMKNKNREARTNSKSVILMKTRPPPVRTKPIIYAFLCTIQKRQLGSCNRILFNEHPSVYFATDFSLESLNVVFYHTL